MSINYPAPDNLFSQALDSLTKDELVAYTYNCWLTQQQPGFASLKKFNRELTEHKILMGG